MADRFVVDASVALAYLLEERGTAAVRSTVTQWTGVAAELLVPSHFWLEVTNSLTQRHAQPPAEVVADLVNLDELGLTTIEPDRPLLLLALDRMVRSQLSAYDAIYLALALATESKLATLDRRLAEAAGTAGMLIGSTRVSEHRAAYRAVREDYAGWSHTAIVGAHIAELRRKALAEAE